MEKLTVERLVAAGFEQVGCWELNSAADLVHRVELPTKAGVYAFAIDGVVHYVGLASKSVRQRLSFYRKPGASQTTNVRLNEIIRGYVAKGTVVEILTAHPPDHDWNGLRISAAEGLEAGLISQFDLAWNVKGARQRGAIANRSPARAGVRQSGVSRRIVELVGGRAGMTELEIAKAIYGPAAQQPQVNQACRSLVRRGAIERRGQGGPADPFVYRLKNGLSE